MFGAQLVIQTLARRGVTTIFSLSGNQIMPLYDACIDAGIRIVHVRHEAAAVFMADAWAQVTGQVGVAMLTAAPGISNGIAPLYSAAQSESPVLLLSGDSPLSEDGWGSFQEMDQAAMSAPLTKHSARITQAAELSSAIDRALDLALAPRPGPVHLALPFDLLSQECGVAELPPRPAAPAAALPTATEVQALAQLLRGAQRPVVLTGPAQGRGALRAQWQQWTQQLALPVVNMGSPRGLRDPSIGAVAGCIAQADVVLLAGKPLDYTLRFGQVPALGEQARVVVVEPDARLRERAARLLGPRLALNLAAAPEHLMPLLASAADAAPAAGRAAWQAQVAQAVASRQLAAPSTTTPARPSALLSPQALCEAVQRVLQAAEEPILVCDGGEFGQWAQAYCSAPVRLINGMSGAIGGGICYAIAAKLARPQATVVLMMGDGTAGFHLPEFDTAAREGAGILAVIGNDLAWNAELVIQKNTYGSDRLIGCSLSASARYHEAAAALGGVGYAADNAEQLESALAAALAQSQARGQPACVNVAIDGRPAPLFSAQAAATH